MCFLPRNFCVSPSLPTKDYSSEAGLRTELIRSLLPKAILLTDNEVRNRERLRVPDEDDPSEETRADGRTAAPAAELHPEGPQPEVQGPLVPGEPLQGLRLPLHPHQREPGPGHHPGGQRDRHLEKLPHGPLPAGAHHVGGPQGGGLPDRGVGEHLRLLAGSPAVQGTTQQVQLRPGPHQLERLEQLHVLCPRHHAGRHGLQLLPVQQAHPVQQTRRLQLSQIM